MFTTLGVLNALNARLKCSTLDALFESIDVDHRTWKLLLRSPLPESEFAVGIERLKDTLFDLVKRLNKKSRSRLDSICEQTAYSEEMNFAHRVFSRSTML